MRIFSDIQTFELCSSHLMVMQLNEMKIPKTHTHISCQGQFSSGQFSSDIFRPQMFVPHSFLPHFFVARFFVPRFFRSVFFRLNIFSSTHFFILAFYRMVNFSFLQFFVHSFFVLPHFRQRTNARRKYPPTKKSRTKNGHRIEMCAACQNNS